MTQETVRFCTQCRCNLDDVSRFYQVGDRGYCSVDCLLNHKSEIRKSPIYRKMRATGGPIAFRSIKRAA